MTNPDSNDVSRPTESKEPPFLLPWDDNLDSDEQIAAWLREVNLSDARRAELVGRIHAALFEDVVVAARHSDERVAITSDRRLDVTVGGPTEKVVPRTRMRTWFHRRYAAVNRSQRWAIALTMTAACLLLSAWAISPIRWRGVGAQELASWAQEEWHPEARSWQPLDLAGNRDEPFLSSWLRKTPARWQPIQTHLDQDSVVYDLPGRKEPTRLFVLHAKRRVTGLPNRPPQQPQTEKDGRMIAAWQEDSRVYVLSVAGPVRNYWEVVRAPNAYSSDDSTNSNESLNN